MEDRPTGFDPPIDAGVVAGVDGSDATPTVLGWAWREAAAHGWPLHVVRAWTLADTAHQVAAPFGVVPSLVECRAAVLSELKRAVELARDGAGPDGDHVPVHLHAVHGPPGEVLVAAAARADLLVVGHRGRGLLQLVLGSVTEHALQHADCPVVVLRVR